MFEKYRLEKFKSKLSKKLILKEYNLEAIKSLYLKAPTNIKNNLEVCEMIFKDCPELISLLPIDFQLSKINLINYQSLEKHISSNVKMEFLKRNILDKDIQLLFIQNSPEILIDYILSDVVSINNFKDASLDYLLDLLNKNNKLSIILNKYDFKNNKKLLFDILNKNKELIKDISSDIRCEYFLQKDKDFIKDNFNYLKENEKVLIFSETLKKYNYIEKEYIINLITNMGLSSQEMICSTNLEYLKYCNIEVQKKFFEKDNELINYLDEDIKKQIMSDKPKYIDNIDIFKDSLTDYNRTYSELNNINYESLNTEDVIKSQAFSAKSSLLMIESTNGLYEEMYGANQYSKPQLNFIRGLPIEKALELCNIDSNYILPYVGTNKEDKEKAKQVFSNMFGIDMLNKYSNTIDYIFDNYNLDCFNNSKSVVNLLKIIFDKNIIKYNDPNLINQYIVNTINNTERKELFNNIINNAYGVDAVDILKSRPNLDENNISSFEVFTPAIKEKFGIGLVHDLLSYNIPNMSYFLYIVKDEKKLDMFYELYTLESNIYGTNIISFQKALNSYSKMESLLKSIDDKDMSNEELNELYKIVISDNYGNIKTKEEIKDYENISKEKLINEISNIQDINYIKDKVFRVIFGINNKDRLYFDTTQIVNLYESSKAYNSELLNEDEKMMLDIVTLIDKEKNKDNLMSLIENILKQENILGNQSLSRAVIKMTKNQEKLLNDNLINVEKLEQELEHKDGKVIKTSRNGRNIYILNGLEFGMLNHLLLGTNNEFIKNIDDNSRLETFATLEEQYGSSTISTWYNTSQVYENVNITPTANINTECSLGFFKIPEGSIVGMGVDPAGISTDHASKLAFSKSKIKEIDFYKISNNRSLRSEVSFYRRERNQSKITNENNGGRIDFDYFSGIISVEDLSNIDNMDINLSGVYGNKPIILVNTYAYSKKNNMIEQR